MKFSNITYGFYPNDEDLLSLYKDLPEDLVDISDEDYLAFRSGDIGPLVHIIDGKLETRTIEIPLTQEQIESKSKSNRVLAIDADILFSESFKYAILNCCPSPM
mgnify:CR=1 FL=1